MPVAGMLTDWGVAVGALAAAAAAIASWRAVWLTKERLEPRLQGYALRDGNGFVGAVVRNTGGGVAEAVHVMLVIGESGFVTSVGHGILAPGEGARILSPIQAQDRLGDVVMWCRAGDLSLRAWGSSGRSKTYRTRVLRRRFYPANNVIYNDLVPDVDLERVTEWPVRLVPLDSAASFDTDFDED